MGRYEWHSRSPQVHTTPSDPTKYNGLLHQTSSYWTHQVTGQPRRGPRRRAEGAADARVLRDQQLHAARGEALPGHNGARGAHGVASDDDVAGVDEAVERGGGVAVGRLAELDAFQDVLAVGVGGERVLVLFGRFDEGEEDDEAVRGVSGRGCVWWWWW